MFNRGDPNRNFKFKVAVGAVLAVAGIGVAMRLRKRSRKQDPKDYIPEGPPPSPPPIIPAGTTNFGRRTSGSRTAARTRMGTKKS